MPGGLLQTIVDARARRSTLIAEAAVQRTQLGGYINALDPASRLIDRLVVIARWLLARPAIPLAVIGAIMVLKPRRALTVGVFAWKAFTWLRRLRGKLSSG
jgi:hypothetical protein